MVGQKNSGPIFSRLCTTVYRIKFACAGVSAVRSLERRFPIDDLLLRPREIRDQVAMLSEIATKFRVLGHQMKLLGEGSPKFVTEFHESASPSNTCDIVW